MNYYALLYDLVDDMVTRRVPFREEHMRLARESRERGELVLAGALTEPVDRALLVFQVDDKSKVESFARKDPYVVNGLAKKWEVRPWNVVVGNEQPASSTDAATAPSDRAAGTILRRWSARTSEASPATSEPSFPFAGWKAKWKSSSRPPGVPSTPSAALPAPTSKPLSSPPKPPRCSPISTAASTIPK